MQVRVREPRRTGLCCAIALALAAVLAPSALACPRPDTTPAFSPWGDEADYFPMPGGQFEDGLVWTGSGSPEVVESDSPFELGRPGSHALRLRAGDAVVSPSICIDRSYRHIRFVLRGLDASSKLRLAVLWTDERGREMRTTLDDHDAKAYRAWGVSRIVRLRKAVPRGEAVHDIRLRFWVEGKRGTWLVDDVYVDPYKRS
jgi:hypothetical protein